MYKYAVKSKTGAVCQIDSIDDAIILAGAKKEWQAFCTKMEAVKVLSDSGQEVKPALVLGF